MMSMSGHDRDYPGQASAIRGGKCNRGRECRQGNTAGGRTLSLVAGRFFRCGSFSGWYKPSHSSWPAAFFRGPRFSSAGSRHGFQLVSLSQGSDGCCQPVRAGIGGTSQGADGYSDPAGSRASWICHLREEVDPRQFVSNLRLTLIRLRDRVRQLPTLIFRLIVRSAIRICLPILRSRYTLFYAVVFSRGVIGSTSPGMCPAASRRIWTFCAVR